MALGRVCSSSAYLLFVLRSGKVGGSGYQNALKEQLHSIPFSTVITHNEDAEEKGSRRWLTLPPFTSTVDSTALGKHLINSSSNNPTPSPTTALKWVAQCCPHIPHTLIQKLFRLRQVRMHSMDSQSQHEQEKHKPQLKRVLGKEIMKPGTKLYLPITVSESKSPKKDNPVQRKTFNPSTDEINNLLFQDPAIIVLNKPPGLPVQGGTGIHKSLDALAAAALKYDYMEPPRLVHRLDKECSGILVMGRTRESAKLLHTLFREKTNTTSLSDNLDSSGRNIKRRYWALVIGILKQKQGRIVAPLKKVILDDGKSERILIADGSGADSGQDAITDYRVIGPPVHGCTWLELFPFTGRKHQIRVHCAEALGTPIVGDFKYGWSIHRAWSPMSKMDLSQEFATQRNRTEEANVEEGSVLAKTPLLHLHCRKLAIPNVNKALEQLDMPDQRDTNTDMLKFVAPLPYHMLASWDFMSLCVESQEKQASS
ncbi:hypothetical protein SUGI_0255570 [Cryptomeria japonica]|nr:hypothetical protein SUGI_0255570 [Cryptomeria japonica]